MLNTLVDIVRSEVSGGIAFDYVAGIARFHRIQASPGFREAAHWCAARLEEAGVRAEILTYPARFGQRYWSQVMFQEWSCRKAVLDLIEPPAEARRLADFRVNRQAVIQRSTSTPPGGLTAGVVVVDKADVPDSYQGRDVAGKFVLFTGVAQEAYRLAVVERGAVGLLTDQMPEYPPVRAAFELPKATTYTSFWHQGPPEKPAVGFVLTPSEGVRLRRLVQSGAPLTLRAEVDASLYDGQIENVSAVIPGAEAGGGFAPEEVLLVAHLCHPQPSANDNASGSGALIETARALAALIECGRLPQPRRSIRFLLVPEMTGTYAYLAARKPGAAKTVAALNLDMVGENQALTGGPLLLEDLPLASPDYVSDLLAAVVEALSTEGRSLHGPAAHPLFMFARSSFSGGSDHYILSDPTVGIPCPMLIQFPDRFYHTSADTIDKVDPVMLGRVATMAAAYVYFWASAGPREAVWLARVMAGRHARDISQLVDREADKTGSAGVPLTRRLGFLAERKAESLRALAQALGGKDAGTWLETVAREVREAAAREERRLAEMLSDLDRWPAGLDLGPAPGRPAAAGASPAVAAAAAAVAPSERTDSRWAALAGCVPRRVCPGPVEQRALLGALSPERRAHWAAWFRGNERGQHLAAQALYWMDGSRALTEVADCLEVETGFRDEAFLAGYADLMVEAGFLEI